MSGKCKQKSFLHTFRLYLLGVITIYQSLSPAGLASAGSDLNQLLESEVQKARAGDLNSSITNLEQYLLANPDNLPLINDLIVLYVWQGNHSKAVELHGQRKSDVYPDYVNNAILSSYRSTGDSESALLLVNTLLRAKPDNTQMLVKKIQLLVDTGRYKEAKLLLDSFSEDSASGTDHLKAAGYFHSTVGEWIHALRNYQQILKLSPRDPEALRGRVNALIHLGAPYAASTYITNVDDLFEELHHIEILQAKAALNLRWSSYSSEDKKESLDYAHTAHTLLLQALSKLPQDKEFSESRTKIQYDLVVALNNLDQHEDCYMLYRNLIAQGSVPGYVSLAVAQSLLALKMPQEAVKLSQEALALSPGDYHTRLALFYAFIENEHFAEAYDLIDAAINQTPAFKTFHDSSSQYPNNERLDLEVIASQARLYGDQLENGWQRISALRDGAPANSWLLQSTGQLALARDWPRKAFINFQTAGRINLDNHSALAGTGQSQIRLHNYQQAKYVLSDLQQRFPEENSTRQLEEDLSWALRPDLWSDFEFSHSKGPEQSGDGIRASGEVISSPLNDVIHLSILGSYAWSELPEGEESLTRFGGGIELTQNPFSLLLLLNYNDSTIEEAGAVIRGTWTPNDQWSLDLQGERFSNATPLRALYYNIREDRVLGSASYRWNESRSLFFSVAAGLFTDDNERIEGSFSFTERIVDIPRFDLDAILELYGSTNSRDNAPYFNPESDFSVNGKLKGEHILHRHYDSSLAQQLTAGFGVYSQKNYSSGGTGSMQYELRYRYRPFLEAALGGEFGINRYDGEDEPYYKLTFRIHAKF